MRVTVCEAAHEEDASREAWTRNRSHVQAHSTVHGP